MGQDGFKGDAGDKDGRSSDGDQGGLSSAVALCSVSSKRAAHCNCCFCSDAVTDDSWEAEAVLGRGSVGTVVLARCLRSGRQFAIKQVDIRSTRPDDVARLQAEIEIMQRCVGVGVWLGVDVRHWRELCPACACSCIPLCLSLWVKPAGRHIQKKTSLASVL